MKFYQCCQCHTVFTDLDFDISAGLETIIMCPKGCIIGTVYIPDICDIKSRGQSPDEDKKNND